MYFITKAKFLLSAIMSFVSSQYRLYKGLHNLRFMQVRNSAGPLEEYDIWAPPYCQLNFISMLC